MCGIAGFLDQSARRGEGDYAFDAARMAETLQHRGPDDAGTWIDHEAGIAFGHRRLSIIDLSAHGHQPMVSRSGRWVVTYNGEIYNFRALRKDLEALGHGFEGHSDTEVLVAAVDQWGPREALRRCNGMFALGLWDRRERTLTLARDRLGEKPLYYGRAGGTFVFASELKALRRLPEFTGEIDREALTLYARYGYVPAPRSIYAGISKLGPGEMLTLGPGSDAPSIEHYWSLRDAITARNGRQLSPQDAVDALDELLGDAVDMRMVADVPLGAFLSGGVDSSLVVALMQSQSSQPVRTFAIGFEEDLYDESRYAREVARHLATDHTELVVPALATLENVPRLARIYDEPFADPSQLPTLLVSTLAREHVTVSLSGDGGDELFAGYRRYAWAERLARSVRGLPAPGRRAAAHLLARPSDDAWAKLGRVLQPRAERPRINERFGDRARKVAELLALPSGDEVYRALVSQWRDPGSVIVAGREPSTVFTDAQRDAPTAEELERLLYVDTLTYLPDDILVKVDRASMAVSLESRIPLLDHRVVEFAWSLPTSLKVRDGQSKWLLRQVLDRYAPRELFERPKQGFDIPLGQWLRGPLREWADALLEPARLRADGFFVPEPIADRWSRHVRGEGSWHLELWNVLMFQAWLEDVREPQWSEAGTAG